MADMLVRLYILPDLNKQIQLQQKRGVEIRRPMIREKERVVKWIRKRFSESWTVQMDVAFCRFPITAFIATRNNKIIAFSAYHLPIKNFFGPIGVDETARGKGIGKALLIASLTAMREEGYGCAIIGGVGPAEFYAKAVGATIIEGSEDTPYRKMIDNK